MAHCVAQPLAAEAHCVVPAFAARPAARLGHVGGGRPTKADTESVMMVTRDVTLSGVREAEGILRWGGQVWNCKGDGVFLIRAAVLVQARCRGWGTAAFSFVFGWMLGIGEHYGEGIYSGQILAIFEFGWSGSPTHPLELSGFTYSAGILVDDMSSGSRTKKETRNIPDEILCGITKRANGTRTEDKITMCAEAIKGELHSHGPRKTRRNGVGAKNSNT
ncbi:hypothetical protein R3P38DRAFT_2786912 [Favolaschia claudopus]|uniref:Uncharacterized protein n=1 Tax=Favolaschia claudopus TaxID=2862362 RepID=A0AAW0ATQ8_9AGAR